MTSETQKKSFPVSWCHSCVTKEAGCPSCMLQSRQDFVQGPFGCEVDKSSLTPVFQNPPEGWVEDWPELIHDAIVEDMEEE